MRRMIESGARKTIADVARQAQVSTATVSRVINDTGPVSAETAERVWQAIAELNYAPHGGARDLAGGRSTTLGLILSSVGGYFFSEMLDGIQGAAGEHDLLIYAAGDWDDERQAFNLPLNEHNTAGLIVSVGTLSDAALRSLSERGLPLVLLHRASPAGLNLPVVTFENEAGARQIVGHLIAAHGCRRIGFLAGLHDHEDARLRQQGYRRALADHNLPYDEALGGYGGYDDQIAETTVAGWLARGVQFDAIFAADDASAMGALTALRRAGLRVPEDVALAGFDDAPLSRHLSPPLTTVRAPIAATGAAAAHQLLRLIETGTADLLTILSTEALLRRSCGCTDDAGPKRISYPGVT